LANPCPLLLTLDRLGIHLLLNELADRLLKLPVAVVIVRRMVALREPCRLGVGYAGESLRRYSLYKRSLALDRAYLQASVLRTKENLVPVQPIECLSAVLAGWR
jgi:hypothetical protein